MRRGLQVVIQLLILMVALFISAGDLGWVWAWAYFGVGVGILIVNMLVLPPEVVAERGRTDKEDIKGWDRVLTTLIVLPSLGLPIVAGLMSVLAGHHNWLRRFISLDWFS